MNHTPNKTDLLYSYLGRNVKLTAREASAKNAGLIHNGSPDRYVLVTQTKGEKKNL